MQKTFVISASIIIACIALLFFLNLRKSWEILPVPANSEMPGGAFQNWHLFEDPAKEFKVMFPSLPQTATNEIKDPKTQVIRTHDMYVDEKPNGSVYMITRVTFPADANISDDSAVLKNAINDLVSANPKNILLNSSPETFQDKKAVKFEIHNDQVYTQGVAFLKDRSLYILTSIYKKENRDDKEFSNFLASFQLNGNKTPSGTAGTKGAVE